MGWANSLIRIKNIGGVNLNNGLYFIKSSVGYGFDSGSEANGHAIYGYFPGEGDNQKFWPKPVGKSWQLVSYAGDRCLNLFSNTANPTLADCNEKSDNQLWNLNDYNVIQLPKDRFQIINMTSIKYAFL
jgi:hypothetical protein